LPTPGIPPKRKRGKSEEIVGTNEILAQYANKQQEKKKKEKQSKVERK